MADLMTVVPQERKFENIELYVLSEKQFESKSFSSLNGAKKHPLKIIVIDHAEDLFIRFIETDGENLDKLDRDKKQQPQSGGQNDSNNHHLNNHSNYDSNEFLSSHTNRTCLVSPNQDAQLTINNHSTNNNGSNHPSLQHLHIGERVLHEMTLYRDTECFSFGSDCYVINCDSRRPALVMIQFKNKLDRDRFARLNQIFKKNSQKSIFNERTDPSSASQYFQFYGYLSQQQNMMQDYVRTSTYQNAIHSNSDDFKDKVVLDVGAGSGILSFFALQAGARKVYAVEASSMAKHAQLLVQSNNCSGKIEIIAGKIEEIQLPEPVDIIISEPMGYMLFNERMLETYLHAKKWLRSRETGRMFPSRGDLHVAPFTDAQLYLEQTNKANFWFSKDFHGVDLRAVHSAATNEYFRQPIVDTFDIRICMAKTVRHVIDFQEANETDLHCISIPLEFVANQTGHIHGLAFWFDVAFIGSCQTVWLSTAPSQPLTHWYQVRCLLSTPLFVNKGQTIHGSCVLRANTRQSYDVDIELFIKGLGTRSSNTLDLKNPYFRYTGQPVQPPPGTSETSPSEQLWAQTNANNGTTTDPYQQATSTLMANAVVGNQFPTLSTIPNIRYQGETYMQ